MGYVYYTHISVALHIDSVEEKEEEEEEKEEEEEENISHLISRATSE